MSGPLPRRNLPLVLADRMGIGSVARSMVGMSAARVAALGIGFASSVLVTRTLGPAGRGDLAVSSSIVAIGVQVGSAGLPGTNTYLVARDPSRRREMLGRTIRLAAIVAVVAGVAGSLSWSVGISPLPEWLMVLTLATIPVGVAYSCLQYLMLGLGRPGFFWQMDIGNRTGYLGLVVAGLLLLGTLTTGQVISFSLVALLSVVIWAVVAVSTFHGRRDTTDAEAFAGDGSGAGYALRTYLATAFAYVVLRADILIANALLPTAQVGNYAAAVTLVEPVIVIPSAVGTVLFGKVAAEPDDQKRRALLRQSIRWTVLLSLAVGLALAVAAPVVVDVVYGSRFDDAINLLRVSAIGLVPFGLTTLAWNYLSALGIPKWTVVAWFVAAVVNVGMNIVLLGRYGIIAAAWTSVATYTALGVWLAWGCRSRSTGQSPVDEAPTVVT